MLLYFHWWFRERPNGQPKEQWKQAGVSGAAEFAGWRRAGVSQPSQVRVWLTVASDWRDARRWIRREISPDSVPGWRSVAGNFREVDSWRRMDIGPVEARVWKQAVGSANAVVRANRLGLSAEDALWFALRGGRVEAWADWLWAGTDSVQDAADWVGIGTRPETARPWLKRDFRAIEAAEWRSQGIGPRRAARRRRRGQSPEARAWVEAGARPDDVVKWRSICSLEELRAWADAGVRDAEEARLLRAEGIDPEEFARWRSLGVTTPAAIVEAAAQWANAERAREWMTAAEVTTLAEATAWREVVAAPATVEQCRQAGLSDPAQVAIWLEAGVDPTADEIRAWGDVGVGTPQDVCFLREAGMDLAEYSRWRSLGASTVRSAIEAAAAWGQTETAEGWMKAASVPTATAAAAWRELVASPADVEAWRKAGFADPSEAAVWVQAGFGPERAGDWRTARLTPAAAAAWERADVPPGQATAWRNVGVKTPAHMTKLAEEGLDVDEVAAWRGLGLSKLDAVLQAASVWPSAAEAQEWVEAGGDLAEAKRWRAVVDSAEAVRLWRPVVEDPAHAAAWLQLGLTPAAAHDWILHGFDLETAWPWVERGIDADEAAAWRSSGHGAGDPEVAGRWQEAGFPPSAAREWIVAGVSDPKDARRLGEQGIHAQDVLRWREIGAKSVRDVLKWASDWTLETAEAWTEEGEELQEAFAWWQRLDGVLEHREALREIGLTSLREFQAMARALPEADPDEIVRACRRFVSVGLSVPDDALRWLRHGDVDHAISWTEVGEREPVKAAAWTAQGFPAKDAGPWIEAGFVDPKSARAWAEEGVPPGKARHWKSAVSHPAEVQHWKAAGVSSGLEAGRWVQLGVRDPGRVVQLRQVGLSRKEFSSLVEGCPPGARAGRLRAHCFARAGIELERGMPTATLTNVAPGEVRQRAETLAVAAYRAGERTIRLRHAWSGWRPEFRETLPDARYVRGHEAIELWELGTDHALTKEIAEVARTELIGPSEVQFHLTPNPEPGLFVLEGSPT